MTDHGNNEESKSADSKGYLESLSHQDVGIFLNALDLQPGLDNKAGPSYILFGKHILKVSVLFSIYNIFAPQFQVGIH